MKNPIKVKAFNPETEQVEIFDCIPCPCCGKWIVINESHRFCSYCGEKLNWEEILK